MCQPGCHALLGGKCAKIRFHQHCWGASISIVVRRLRRCDGAAVLVLPSRCAFALIIVHMTNWFVFNGDADGICAAHQLRLAGVVPERIVTGVKRDVLLLERATAVAGDHVIVADISLDTNRDALTRLLAADVRVTWFDHHHAGVLPQHQHFEAHIDTAADLCSSLLVNRHLNGRYRAWAVTAAFGDNLADAARDSARALDLDDARLEQLQELGVLMNYNAYGETVSDLKVDPGALFARLDGYDDPFRFIETDPFVTELRESIQSDLTAARGARALMESAHAAAFELPDAPWARRVQGVFANELASGNPQRAHALLVKKVDGYVVSVRAPQANLRSADKLCRAFASGGGRAGAAGVNHLPFADTTRFLEEFVKIYAM